IVDNAVAAETTDGPFDSLAWDLTGYSASGTHSVQVIVFDELGLEARSEAVNVLVTVNIPPPLTTTFGPMVVGVIGIGIAGVALAALVAIVVFVRRPTIITNIVREASGRVKEITEPFIPTPHRGAAKQKQGKGFLERIDETSPGPHPTIELIGDNLRLGRDETLAQIAINDRSVSRLHCRVTEEADGLFFIHDEGSTSGTWVNYSQVSLSGQQLRHGDVINLGRVQLRFRLRFKDTPPTPATPATPVSTPEAPPEEVPAHSTEPFEPAMQSIKVTDETTDQGVPLNKTKPITQPVSDEYHTEAFTPAFDESSKPKTSDE
ncbi:MAG TPA: FHA domain-containing protein, partial [Anaerolineales bacterium]|nr:FHA domain-containing protein [Anaerolineales bacterium]